MKFNDKTKSELIKELQQTKAEVEHLKSVVNRLTNAVKPTTDDDQLAETKNRFYTLLQDVTQVAVQGYQMDGTTVFWNKAAETVYGYSADEAIGQNLLDLIIPDEMQEVVRQEIKYMSQTGIPMPSGELRLKRKDGSYVHVFSSHTVLSKPGSPPEMYCVDIDLTHRIHIEQELVRAREKAEESDRLKSAFLANISHEIRTPMNGIMGFAELLKEPNLTGEQQKDYIRIIERSGNRMLNIINDIVDISRIEAGMVTLDIKETDINEHMQQLYDFFLPESASKDLKLTVHKPLPAQEVTFRTDNAKVYAILSNLLKNAIRFTDRGEISFGYQKNANALEFYVKDTGIGIPVSRQDAIFERFIQADIADKEAREGAGLGLAISKAYTEMLGGKIWLESEQGTGSTFYFTLPLDHQPQG